MRTRLLQIVMPMIFSIFIQQATAAEITIEGQKLAKVLDQSRVDQLWPAGVHVAWETGVPDGKPEKTEGKHTHCSAFAAATAKKLGVYLLRPPEHGQILLANAQNEWLEGEGSSRGWNAVENGARAQEFANRGFLVVATYHNHKDDKPGHIAIVRPSNKSAREISAEGPQITQAGGTNYISTSLMRGFAGHPAAFAHNEVRYYAHAVDWKKR
jgi:hypothetical protein